MRRTTVLALLAFVAAATPATASPAPGLPPSAPAGLPPAVALRLGLLPGASSAPQQRSAAAAAQPCDAAPDGACGSVDVPLDRSRSGGPTLRMQYVRFAHTNATPSKGTIFVTEGGPGFSALTQEFANPGFRPYYDYVFPALEGDYDLVLFDQRGVGRSQVIDCPALQGDDGAGDAYAEVAACGQQLGGDSDLYGSVDVAEDVDALRAKLGLRKFIFYGGSYAAADIQAYAARHAGHLRSVILDSPAKLFEGDPFYASTPRAIARATQRGCQRSVSCSAANRSPVDSVAWLAARLHDHPVDGTGYDAQGNPHAVHFDETTLTKLLQYDSAATVNYGDLPAAAAALRRGDAAPLLRLGAENSAPFFGGFGDDLASFSIGANLARACTNGPRVWDAAASPAVRRTQYDAAVRSLPAASFFPFSKSGWLAPVPNGVFPDPCIAWPAPTHHRPQAVPSSARTSVPTLILAGDVDFVTPIDDAWALRKMFYNGTVVDLAGSHHHTVFRERGDCAHQIISQFVTTGAPGDTSCAPQLDVVDPAVGQFPRTTAEQGLGGVRVQPGDRSTARERRAAAVAIATITDTLKRGFGTDGADALPGLRGGSSTFAYGDDGAEADLTAVRYARDLPITGHVSDGDGYTTLDATITLTGAATGTLHVTGLWWTADADRLQATGTLNGRKVAITVPAT